MTSEDKKRYNAIRYIVANKYGYMDELIDEISQKYIDEFISLGFIHEGYTRKKKTWKCLELAKQYYSVIN